MDFYSGLRKMGSSETPELGGNINQGDPYSYSPTVWDYLVRRFAVRSVLDVGCGQGHAAQYFHCVHRCATLAIDGLRENLDAAVYPVIVHDLRSGPFVTCVDLVHSVEHVEPEYIDHVITTLACGRVVAMTHATPEQPGHHHVNCQPSEYWISLMTSRGFGLAEEDTRRVRAFADRDGAMWFAGTGLVFVRG